MLEKLLSEIQSGGTLEPGLLAARLGTSPEMVSVMLEHLVRLGKLQALADCSPQGCDGCGLSTLCLPKNDRGKVWQLNSTQ